MQFSSQFLEVLNDRVVLSDLIAEKVKLKKNGNHWTGLCPFHQEKTPSFHVYNQEGHYHCYGCGAHGDGISFIQETKGFAFPEAVEYLATLFGVPIPQEEVVNPVEHKKRQQKKTDQYDIHELACTWFQEQLNKRKAQHVQDYLKKRELSEETVSTFRLGYAPHGNGLRDHLLSHNITPQQMHESGLIIQSEIDRSRYDRFRERLMFPIFDRSGKVIAFGGRLLEPGEPKYLNSPETPLFHKSYVLYGLSHARKNFKKDDTLIVTEGYMDVIALHQAGIKQSVAPLGTALTEDHIKQLWRITPLPILCFDGDKAGVQAALRSALRALPLLHPGYSLRYVFLPQGEDPDSMIRSGGLKTLKSHLERPQNLIDVVWKKEISEGNFQTPENKALFEKKLMGHLFTIEDESVKARYQEEMRARLYTFFSELKRKQFFPSQGKKRNSKTSTVFHSGATAINSEELQLRILFATVINHPQILDDTAEELATLDIHNHTYKKVRDSILLALNLYDSLDESTLKHHLVKEGFESTVNDLLSDEIYMLAPFIKTDTEKEKVLRNWTHIKGYVMNREHLENDLKEAQAALKKDLSSQNWKRIQKLTEQIEALKSQSFQFED